jgi:hypothetical protein
LAANHLNESVALVDVDNTGLNDAELVKERTEVSLGGDAGDKEGAATNLDVTRANGIVLLKELLECYGYSICLV